MESINQDLSEIRKQRKLYQDSYATLSKGVRHRKMHRRRSVYWSKISLLLTIKVIAILGLLWTVVVIASFMITGRIESTPKPSRVITDYALGTAQNKTTTSNSVVPVTGGAAQILETPQPLAAGQTSRKATAGEKPRQIFRGPTTSPRDTTMIAADTTTSTASLRRPARAASGVPASTASGPDSAASKATDFERQDHAANKQPAAVEDKGDQWVLNLVSLTSKASADTVAEKALSQDINTEQQQVTVNGKHYWRVQITGFPTAAEATAYADTAKEKLGLKDVWIMKR